MSDDSINRKFGEIAAEEGIISRKTFRECISKHREIRRKRDPYPTFKSFLIRTQDLSEEEVHHIEQLLRQDPDQLDLPGYDIQRKLGKGTTGTVYKATQLKLDRPVAIKLLHPSLADDDSYVDRFYQEIRTVGTLKHSGIVQGIDVGEEDGLIYFIMEYVEGDSLAEVIEDEGRLSVARVIKVGLEMTTALSHAADKGLIHRDVKPDNIMFDDSGSAKLCDLGLAREVGDEDQSERKADEVVGTPYYMSPEQASGNELDIRSDLYSLGATLYHAVTGTPPFDGNDIETIMTKHVSDELEPPRERNNQLSPQFNAVIKKMMAKEVDDRYESPEEASEDFERLRNTENPIHATFKKPDPNKRTRINRHLNRSWLTWETATGLIILMILSGITLAVYNSSNSSVRLNPASVESNDQEEKTGPKNSSDPTINQTNDTSKSEKEKGPDASNQNQKNTDGSTRSFASTFDRIKRSADDVQGTVTNVEHIVNRLEKLSENVERQEKKQKIHRFRQGFINQQARIYLRRKTDLENSGDLENASIETLVRTYRILQNPPNVFASASFITGSDNPPTKVEDLIAQRTREKNRRSVSRIQHNLPDDLAQILKEHKVQNHREQTNTGPTDHENNSNGQAGQVDDQSDGGPASRPTQRFPLEKQAEHAELKGSSIHSDASGYRGEAYVAFDRTNDGGQITWNIQLSREFESPFRLQFRYSLDRETPFPMVVLVNGNEVATGHINPTESPDNWQTFALETALQEGANTIVLRGGDSDGPNLDALKIIPQEDMEGEAEQTVADKKQDRPSYEGPLEFANVGVGDLAFAINFGGKSVENGGISFDQDPFGKGGNESSTGSREHASGEISPKKFQSLFSDQRMGKDMTFTFPLANGTYDIRLYLIEPWYEQQGARVFHVLLQDKPVLSNFDIYQTINEKNQGMMKTFQDVPVKNNRLTLQLKGRVEAGITDDAVIAGIAIKRTGKP